MIHLSVAKPAHLGPHEVLLARSFKPLPVDLP
jgi:hypothetical protein